mgnify:CR=1 FL=1|jgi:hypothetical protein
MEFIQTNSYLMELNIKYELVESDKKTNGKSTTTSTAYLRDKV